MLLDGCWSVRECCEMLEGFEGFVMSVLSGVGCVKDKEGV
jgi:hypothetical protein